MSTPTTASVLVVDDEDIVCESCSKILGADGFSVSTCTNPVEGLEVAESDQYSAILLDLKMQEMDGLEFLGQLRQRNPDVPVVVITGYPSTESENAAFDLGAQGYLPKPFTPDELKSSLRRVTAGYATGAATAASPGEAVTAEPAPNSPWESTGESPRFVDEAWLQVGEDATVRVGAVLPRLRRDAAWSLRLPEVGDTVYRGLPLASLEAEGEPPRTIPSAVTGVVVEVNRDLLAHPESVLSATARDGWMVRIRPVQLEADIRASRSRNVILVSASDITTKRYGERLADLGCRIHGVRTAEDAVEVLRAHEHAAVLWDEGSFEDDGPAGIDRILSLHPETKVVVFSETQPRHEAAYRTKKIFFYAVQPLEDDEILDVVCNVFKFPERSAVPDEVESKYLPNGLSTVHITNRKGSNVSLLSFGTTLYYHKGVGRQLIGKILKGAFPLETTRGTLPDDSTAATRINKEAARCDRVVVLVGRQSGGIPGQLSVLTDKELFAGVSQDTSRKLTILAVETAVETGVTPLYDVRTTNALADSLLEEMVSK